MNINTINQFPYLQQYCEANFPEVDWKDVERDSGVATTVKINGYCNQKSSFKGAVSHFFQMISDVFHGKFSEAKKSLFRAKCSLNPEQKKMSLTVLKKYMYTGIDKNQLVPMENGKCAAKTAYFTSSTGDIFYGPNDYYPNVGLQNVSDNNEEMINEENTSTPQDAVTNDGETDAITNGGATMVVDVEETVMGNVEEDDTINKTDMSPKDENISIDDLELGDINELLDSDEYADPEIDDLDMMEPNISNDFGPVIFDKKRSKQINDMLLQDPVLHGWKK